MARSRYDVIVLPGIYRGDSRPMQITYTWAAQDLTDILASVIFRKNPNSPALATKELVITHVSPGVMIAAFALTGEETQDLPEGTIYGDVQLFRDVPRIGPKSWVRFQTDVTGDFTYASV